VRQTLEYMFKVQVNRFPQLGPTAPLQGLIFADTGTHAITPDSSRKTKDD
jgi:hypothetical protein